MRRAFYIILLLAIAVTGLAGMVIGLDHLINGGEFGAWFFYLGLYWSSLATVTLAEDVAEWLARPKAAPLPSATILLPN